MPTRPWAKFYWNDWRGDPALRLCSVAARGLWMDMLCVAAEADPIGYVTVASKPLDVPDLVRLSGEPADVIEPLLAELRTHGVFSVTRDGRIYNRRMVRDAKKARNARENGLLGGNPTLRKHSGIPPPDNPQDKLSRADNPEARVQNLESKKEIRAARLSLDEDFERWWAGYPEKVAKPTAKKAFPKALAKVSSVEDLIAGVERYKATKPVDRPWCNPSTWLNQERWSDVPATTSNPVINGGFTDSGLHDGPTEPPPTLAGLEFPMDRPH